nr:cell surface protein [uncultured archaeon GZfos1D1]
MSRNRNKNALAFVVLFAMLAFVTVGCASATTYTVCPSGCDYTSIQAAIDAADPINTIEVHSGTYYENVNVNKQLILKGTDTGSGKPVVDAGGSGNAITLSEDEITLEGFTATNSDPWRGIYLYSSSNNTITGNNACNNRHGICLYSSSNNTITGNNVSNNNYSGICLWDHSNNNTITGNNATNNNYGIHLSDSSNNTLTSNTANLNNWGINMDHSSNNAITCNWVQNNKQNGFRLSWGSTGNNISHNNVIENGNYNATSGGWEWQFYIDQYQPAEAKHNYWGAGMNNSTIDASIYDDEEGGWVGEVEFYPFETDPVPCAPTPDEPPAFTTADAVIALEIAVGSREYDSRWDVSGDGRVISLDALMILQAAAGAISL